MQLLDNYNQRPIVLYMPFPLLYLRDNHFNNGAYEHQYILNQRTVYL